MKEIHKAYLFKVYPNEENLKILNQSMGCARFVYNHVLNYSIKEYKKKING